MPEHVLSAAPGPDDRSDQAALYRALAAGDHRGGDRGTVAFAVSTADLDAGAGDVYVALGLAKYLARLGWGVELWPVERWEDTVADDVVVVVSMLESFVPGRVPQDVGLVAWIRNWTDTWASLPFLGDFDAVWTSSSPARDRVLELHDVPVTVLPIGVDLELFTGERGAVDDIEVVTTVNFWGAERVGLAAIDVLAASRDVVWYGANREHLARSERIEHRGRASFFDLPAVYAAAAVVVDDVIPPAAAYGTQNSRLFEGLASGSLVVTNCATGLDELGLADVPVYDDGPSLAAAVGRRTDALVEHLRAVVVERHSYAVRASTADADLRRVVTARSGRSGADRGAVLVWAAQLRERLRRAEHDRDVHFAGVHDINERLVVAVEEATANGARVGDLTAERDRLAVRLDEVTRGRAYRLAERIAGLLGRR